MAGGDWCFFAQPWKVRPAKAGSAASRWMPIVFSIATRSGLTSSDLLAIGAAGVASLPSQFGWPSMRSRSLTPSRSFRRARAWLLISAMWTPCGHTWVQMPQPEQ